jgi:hypothetical protein
MFACRNASFVKMCCGQILSTFMSSPVEFLIPLKFGLALKAPFLVERQTTGFDRALTIRAVRVQVVRVLLGGGKTAVAFHRLVGCGLRNLGRVVKMISVFFDHP